jgi:hypothetical protein
VRLLLLLLLLLVGVKVMNPEKIASPNCRSAAGMLMVTCSAAECLEQFKCSTAIGLL